MKHLIVFLLFCSGCATVMCPDGTEWEKLELPLDSFSVSKSVLMKGYDVLIVAGDVASGRLEYDTPDPVCTKKRKGSI